MLLIEENESAIDIYDALARKNVDIIPIINKDVYTHQYHYENAYPNIDIQ